jgi:hypothetical protein
VNDRGDDAHPLDLPEEDQVVYELGDWPLDMQAAAAEALAEAEIPHAFDGTDLVVHVDWEEAVDELLDDIERAGVGDERDGDGEGDAAERGGRVGGDVVYELDDWPLEQRDRLSEQLAAQDIPYRWEDETSLVVLEADEARAELVLDEIEFPDGQSVEVAEAEVDEEDALDDEQAEAEETSFEVLSLLYLAADRLKGNPLDADGLADLNTAIEEADIDVPPYGITPGVWHTVVEQANALADAITDDDQERNAEAAETAASLRTLLRPYV